MGLRFVADECCDATLVAHLRKAGHDVQYIVETMPGADDAAVLACAYDERRILLTEDKDFGELVIRLRQQVHGVVLLRFAPQDEASKADLLLALIEAYGSRLPEAFVVLDAERIRLRPL